ncbi:MAG: hypothetical protein AB7F59_13415 [Bdellovibrionales bacterium]
MKNVSPTKTAVSSSVCITNWGATKEEMNLHLPGEEFLTNPEIATTQAITINARPEQIWPWLVQIGQGRGGFYSHSFLENLIGCHVKNVTEIRPELQNLKVGDEIKLHPKAPGLRVNVCDPHHTLAMDGWIFHLIPMGPCKTRLISRTYQFQDFEMNGIMSAIFELAHFIMGRKQLIEIKRLVEEQASSFCVSDVLTNENKRRMAGEVNHG